MSATNYSMYVSGTSALAYKAPTLRLVPGGPHAAKRPAVSEPRPHRRQAIAPAHRISTNYNRSIMLAVASVALCLIMAWLFTARTSEAYVAQCTTSVAEATEVVHAGDGLQDIAVAHPIEGLTVAQTARWISQRNNLGTSMLSVGQTLIVPRASA